MPWMITTPGSFEMIVQIIDSACCLVIVLFLTSVLRLGAGMISLSARASMDGDIILQDCEKDFVLPVFLLGLLISMTAERLAAG
jgi:hypothetical protein